MRSAFSALISYVVSHFRSDESLRLENMALRHQLAVYQQTVKRSPGHEWVGAERGSLRPVSPLPPLRPCMRLSHSHGHRQEDLQGSIFPEPLRVHSP